MPHEFETGREAAARCNAADESMLESSFPSVMHCFADVRNGFLNTL